jgi:hypothetical protein
MWDIIAHCSTNKSSNIRTKDKIEYGNRVLSVNMSLKGHQGT